MALLPIRTLATPLCALTGQVCALSLATKRNGPSQVQPAKPFWMWTWSSTADAVNVGEVARSLAKEATGAKDIFESVAKLSDGGIMDRLEYVRIWELGVAVQVGSSLDEKEFLGKGLVDLGNNAKDLSDELVELNAMAVNAFTWLQWEVSFPMRRNWKLTSCSLHRYTKCYPNQTPNSPPPWSSRPVSTRS